MHCHLSRQVWFTSQLGLHPPPLSNLLNWLNVWINNKDPLACQIFCCTLWKIWKHRNDCVFNNKAFNPCQVALSATLFVSEFNVAAQAKQITVQSINEKPPWHAPNFGTIKVNVDAGCCIEGRTCWGMLVRDHEGTVLHAATNVEDIALSPIMAEALGLRWSLSWAKERDFTSLEVETDSASVVKCLGGGIVLAEIALVIGDCRELLNSMANCTVSFVPRESNAAAHFLVQTAKTLGNAFWSDRIPLLLASVICNDIARLS